MKNVNYEKPEMVFVDLRNEQVIAAADGPCMAQAAHGHTEFYYDAPGDGWVQILTLAENCNGNATFTYIDNPDIPGEVEQSKKNSAIAEAMAALKKDKQAFSGAVVDQPDPSWS
ncbi:MAG: hypothetical protein ACI4D9_08765 [Lachnospiraceae bacterium]